VAEGASRPGPADRLAGRRLYLCTPDRPDLGGFVAACIRGGVDIVQLREKSLEARPLLERARLVHGICRDLDVPFILNDRPDLAVECGADGVHVGQEDAPPALARRLLGPAGIVGLSTHTPADLDAAAQEPVDYLSAGPVNRTPTKPGRPGTGPGYIGYAARNAAAPIFVTGGVTPQTVAELAAAGARRFVVVRWLTEAGEPEANARQLADAIRRALDGVVAGGPA
jgi:thiamine-phosphate pyrophosphorylase